MISKLCLCELPLKYHKTCSFKVLLKTQLISMPNLSEKSLKMFSWQKGMDLKPLKYSNRQNNFNLHTVLAILANKI